MFSLKLNDELRIEYATYPKYASDGMVVVDKLPDGDIHDYLYVNGEYVFSPIIYPDTSANTGLEERVSAIEDELEATKIILGVE